MDYSREKNLTASIKWLHSFLFNKHIAVSKFIANTLPYKSTIIENSIPLIQKNPHKKKTKDVVFIGRLIKNKGCHLLLKAIKKIESLPHQRFRYTIIGDGHEREKLEQLAIDYKLQNKIKFTGAIPNKKVHAELTKYKIIVIPSLWEEPFGLVVLEGFNAGCVPVAFDSGALKDVIGEAGITVKKGDYNTLAKTISSLLNDNDKLTTFKNKIPLQLVKFDFEKAMQKFISELEF